MGKLLWLSILVSATVACACPNGDGVNHSQEWSAQRDAACAVWDGCDKEYMAELPVYEASDEEIHDVCGANKVACFCRGATCSGVILIGTHNSLDTRCYDKYHSERCWQTRGSTMLHEYVHAVMAASDIDTSDHGPNFQAVLRQANAQFRQM